MNAIALQEPGSKLKGPVTDCALPRPDIYLVAICRRFPSGPPIQISFEFHRMIEMMKANDMLLRTVLGNRVRILPKIGKFHTKIEEFHLTAAEPHPA